MGRRRFSRTMTLLIRGLVLCFLSAFVLNYLYGGFSTTCPRELVLNEVDTSSESIRRVRVLCWVMTNPETMHSKAAAIKETWGPRCDVLLFMSSKADASFPTIGLDVPENYNEIWAKTKAAFRYVYQRHFNDADWFFKADDNTYVIVENLRYMLKDYNPNDPVYFGRKFKPFVVQGYMSGGSGYVLSREALRRFNVHALNNPDLCKQSDDGMEDIEMGKCLQNTGVFAMDSRDNRGRQRFYPLPPWHHLIDNILPRDFWMFNYEYYKGPEGPENCAEYSVAYHYIDPEVMYLMHHFIYHFRLSVPVERQQTTITTVLQPTIAEV